ncbi:hypothetical protein NEFER03_1604 [Nematocida sp. LUAm3]|nr:hypothetical protein NEFER03_1604 [Nematocida sp. LUAm3]KAI5176136.1 hypothetical protein NEFER02_1957 [Nematocida sp. LUAm2]KAI5179024.1 hypothetical protein NEFER01_1900 [Nematocida sp. LUAm1]
MLSTDERRSSSYAFLLSGVFFIFLGFLLLDRHLVFAGNIVVAIGVLLNVKDLKNYQPLFIFLIGFAISFKLIAPALAIEAIGLFLWFHAKIFSLFSSPKRVFFSYLLKKKL